MKKSLAVDDIHSAIYDQLNVTSDDPWVYEVLIEPLEAVIRDGDQYFRAAIAIEDEAPVLSDRGSWIEVEQVWVEKSIQRRSVYQTVASERDKVLLVQGGEIKALGSGKIGGHLVMFGDADQLDLEDDFFTAETDFDLYDGKQAAVYYEHGLDPTVKLDRLGHGPMKQDDVGVWIETQLSMRNEYEEAIYGLAEKDKLGWSSGTAPHLMSRKRADKGFWIEKWPLGLDASLTPMPAEPRIHAIPLKSYTPRVTLKQLLLESDAVGTLAIEQWGPEHLIEATKIYIEVQKE